MKRGTILTLSIFLALCFSFSIACFTKMEVKGSNDYPVHNLDTGLNYTSIQGAINANETLDGHTILVDAGTYFGQIVINKSLTLLGQNRSLTVLDGSSNPTAITVTADNVNIQEFTIQNEEVGYYDGGIHVTSDNNIISQNTIVNNYGYGIWIEESDNTTVTHNNISMNRMMGVWIDVSTNTFIYKNRIFENQDTGIFATSSSGIKVEGNNFFSNRYMAIYFMACNNSIASTNVASNNTHGAYLSGGHSNVVYNNSITLAPPTIPPSGFGIYLGDCFNCTAIRNRVSNHSIGVLLFYTHNNTVLENHFFNNTRGIYQGSDNNTTISENTLTANDLALELIGSRDALIFHNNFLQNDEESRLLTYQIELDNGFEGNFWDNYTGVDLNHDGIGDTAYMLDEVNTDNFPLMGMFSNFKATSEHNVQTICNSTISEFNHNGTAISFNVTGGNGSAGFCRICIPTALLNETYQVFVNRTEVDYTLLPVSNSTHSYLYFTYDHSTKEVVIIPELPSLILPSLFMLGTLLATVFYRRKSKVCT